MRTIKTSGVLVTCLVVSACSGGKIGPGGGQSQGGSGDATCRSDVDCAADEECSMSHSCPPGAYCILPATPGTCHPRNSGTGGITGSGGVGNCGGQTAAGGTTTLPPAQCNSDSDCAPGQTCSGASNCPPGAICILPARPGVCEGPIQCSTSDECPAGEVCKQVIFPIMPPPGYDGGLGPAKLGECTPESQSLGRNTIPSSNDDWWQVAEAALRAG